MLTACALVVTSCDDDKAPGKDFNVVDKEEIISDIFGDLTPEFIYDQNANPIELEGGTVTPLPAFKASYKWKATVSEIAGRGNDVNGFSISLNEDGSDSDIVLSGSATGNTVQLYIVSPEPPVEGNVEAAVELTVEDNNGNSLDLIIYEASVIADGEAGSDEPENPDNPDDPEDDPVLPDSPTDPGDTDDPSNPDTPTDPSNPGDTDDPNEPEEPEGPTKPAAGETFTINYNVTSESNVVTYTVTPANPDYPYYAAIVTSTQAAAGADSCASTIIAGNSYLANSCKTGGTISGSEDLDNGEYAIVAFYFDEDDNAAINATLSDLFKVFVPSGSTIEGAGSDNYPNPF